MLTTEPSVATNKIPVIAIVGPTASGKSSLADAVASYLDSEVLSCDAMQIYRRMDIGTAKMTPDECSVPLRLVDICEPAQDYSAALYQRDARVIIDELLAQNRIPVLCGGTGLYLKAALDEMNFSAGELESESRIKYNKMAEEMGPLELHAYLAQLDPRSAKLIHPNNVRRTIRALEMYDEGVCYADQTAGLKTPVSLYNTLYFGLYCDREVLYKRINKRVDQMMEMGLVDEVQSLCDEGFAQALTSTQAIGYKEIIDYFNGLCTLDEAVEMIKMRSRRYAKRQLSWFKRDKRITWINTDLTSQEERVALVLEAAQAFKA